MQPIRLRIRGLSTGDAPVIAQIMRRITVLHRAVDQNLETIIARIIEQRLVVGAIVEQANNSQTGTETVLGVTFSGFLQNEFAEAYLASPSPLLTSQCLRSVVGDQSILLDRKSQANANLGDGLHLAILEMAVALPDPASQSFREVLHHLYGAHLEFLRGFKIKSVLTEASEEFAPLIEGTGLRTLNRHFLNQQEPDIISPAGRSPHRCLFGISSTDLIDLPASSAASVVMTYVPPHLKLTFKEQDFLSLAIQGLTDIALAEELGISPNTVKQTWRNIYDHCLEVVPEIFGSEVITGNSSSRGQEKRRSVLVYIRNNLQELRPHHLRRN